MEERVCKTALNQTKAETIIARQDDNLCRLRDQSDRLRRFVDGILGTEPTCVEDQNPHIESSCLFERLSSSNVGTSQALDDIEIQLKRLEQTKL